MQLTEDPARRRLIREIERGPRRIGRTEYIKILKGQYCTQRERILAKCFDCAGFYADGGVDCQNKTCPLYKFMPYRRIGGDSE
ncbi:hypothetical protein KTGMC3_P1077 [Methanocalculus sp. MC3]